MTGPEVTPDMTGPEVTPDMTGPEVTPDMVQDDDGYRAIRWTGRASANYALGYEQGFSEGYASGFEAAYSRALKEWAEKQPDAWTYGLGMSEVA